MGESTYIITYIYICHWYPIWFYAQTAFLYFSFDHSIDRCPESVNRKANRKVGHHQWTSVERSKPGFLDLLFFTYTHPKSWSICRFLSFTVPVLVPWNTPRKRLQWSIPYTTVPNKLVPLILSPRKVVPQFGIAKWFVLISLTMSNCWGLLGDMDICSILQGFSQGTNSAIRRTFRTLWARTNLSTPWASTLCAAGSGSFRPPAPYQETHTSLGRFFWWSIRDPKR